MDRLTHLTDNEIVDLYRELKERRKVYLGDIQNNKDMLKNPNLDYNLKLECQERIQVNNLQIEGIDKYLKEIEEYAYLKDIDLGPEEELEEETTEVGYQKVIN